MKYVLSLLITLIIINNSFSNPWLDGTWKFPVYYTENIYRLQAHRLTYDCRTQCQNTIVTMPNKGFNSRPTGMRLQRFAR